MSDDSTSVLDALPGPDPVKTMAEQRRSQEDGSQEGDSEVDPEANEDGTPFSTGEPADVRILTGPLAGGAGSPPDGSDDRNENTTEGEGDNEVDVDIVTPDEEFYDTGI